MADKLHDLVVKVIEQALRSEREHGLHPRGINTLAGVYAARIRQIPLPEPRTKECFRCHRVGVRGFTKEAGGPPYWYSCAAQDACKARKLRYLRTTYPQWGQ